MIGIILVAHGAPRSIDEVDDYFKHILKGKTPSAPMLDNIKKQYRKFGTCDPLGSITSRLAIGIQNVLELSHKDVKVYNAYKHTAPFIDETVGQMIEDGMKTIVTLPITPIFSKKGTGEFQEQVQTLVNNIDKSIEVIHIHNWNTHPALVSVLANRVKDAYSWLSESVRQDSAVLFTVHSQPVNPEMNQVYVTQFTQLATAIANEIGLSNWQTTYRSGANRDGWLGPNVKEAIRQMQKEGVKGIVTCELLSLVADIESFFEIGEECHELCQELDLEFARAEFPNDSYDIVIALAAIINQQINK
ncbi:ferrochelatase [Bacillus massiliigorillae]|uniref:ferrochelatase n=1 Tax=Bacillus massiliigorillae TaxID=1243664 RepID=UPI0003A1D055|nr:ferrochelatase [Bacillus massiliigorillae]